MITITLIIMVALMLVGVPIAFSLAISGCIGLWLIGDFGNVMTLLGTVPYRTCAAFLLTVIPMFILLAEITSRSGLAKELFDLANKWIGHWPGGVGIATILAAAGFAAMAGTSSASAAVFSRIAIPEMQRLGYKDHIAAGVVTVAGTLAIMIPPSLTLVVYGILTETSIGKLLIAGVIPGLLSAFMFTMGIFLIAKFVPDAVKSVPAFSWKERFAGLVNLLPLIVLIIIIMGGLYSGIATPTEVAALGAFSALIICLIMRRINAKEFASCLKHTVIVATMIFSIIIGAMIFGYFTTLTQVPQNLINYIKGAGFSPWSVIAILVVVYLFLGCFFDQLAILLLTIPLTFPLITSLGYNPIWFGIVFTKLTEIGLVTPPLGLNAYVVSGASKIPLTTVFSGASMLLAFDAITLALLLFFPILSTYLPSLMK
jgi:C4-dicarboxylate transporter, DctM subunit